MDIIIDAISKQLYELFFYNKKAYAIQEDIDGSVNFFTKYDKIDANKLSYYINNKKSLLAYQQRFDKLMWICLDFDIKTYFIKQIDNYDYFKDMVYRPQLIDDVKKTINFLDEKHINYLLEYSGNRGVHVWVFFDGSVPKRIGFEIISKIQYLVEINSDLNKENPIGIDLFPKVPESRNNKVGKGVKIPLAFHLKSRRYSYLIDNSFDIVPISDLNEEFLVNQHHLLAQVQKNDIKFLLETLEIRNLQQIKVFDRISWEIKEAYDTSNIINMLSRCAYFKAIFAKKVSDWDEEERKLVVGTIIRLKYAEDDDYGVKILIQIFSNSDEYDEELTASKLNMLRNLYPPTIQYLESIFRYKCQFCTKNNIKNVVELIDNTNIAYIEFDRWDYIINWSIGSEKNYLMKNDEAPLNFIFDELSTMDIYDINKELNGILDGKYQKPCFYSFLREEPTKTRQMYALGAKDRVVTTAVMKYIYDIIGDDKISDISYSYKLNSIPTKKEIFIDWNQLWTEFVRDVTDCAFHESYENYYVIRIDIKSFYDSIDVALLQQIIHSQTNSKINNDHISFIVNSLSEDAKKKYVNACNYLIYVCKSISNTGKGVPQGPAFARFLAELYLSVFDKFLLERIDRDYDVALRYVDDYYIFIKNHEVYEKVKNEILIELGSIYLDVNDKFLAGRVSDLRDIVIEKNQLEKYFIDGISENAPKAVIDKAISILHNMFVDMEENGDVKNFPFFLTHLLDEEYKKRNSEKIISTITSSSIGRGSMFKHFYNKLAFEYSDLSFYKNIKGLSRLNFLCQFANNINFVSSDRANEIINYYLTQELTEIEVKEIIRIILITGVDADVSLLLNNEDNTSYLLEFLCYSPNLLFSESNFERVIESINSYSDKIIALFAFENLLTSVSLLYNNHKIINYIYSLLHENLCIYTKTQICIQKAFNLLAYISLYDNIDRVQKLWSNIEIRDTESINGREWLKYESKIKATLPIGNNIATILVKILSGISFIDNKKANGYENEYAICLLTFVFGNVEITDAILDSKNKEDIKSIAKVANVEFISWLIDGAGSLLDPYFTMKNLQYNNRMTLCKGNELLIRGKQKIFRNKDCKEEKWFIDNPDIFYSIVKNDKSFQGFRSHFRGRNIIEVIQHIDFIRLTMFNTNEIINIFEKGSYSTGDNAIALDYSTFDDVFILENRSEIQTSNIENVKIGIIREIIYICNDIDLLPYEFYGDFCWRSLSNDIIPQNNIFKKGPGYEQRVYEYMVLFSQLLTEYLSKHIVIDMYNAEKLRIETIQKLCKKELLVKITKDSTIETVLSLYNSGYGKEYNKYLLYKKVNIVNRKNTNILLLLQNLISSIEGNLHFDFSISALKLLQGYINKLTEFLTMEISCFIFVRVHFNRDKKIVEINDQTFYFQDVKCCFVKEGKAFELVDIMDENSYEIERSDLTFFFDGILVVLPAVYSTCLDIIQNKSDIFDVSVNEVEKKVRCRISNSHKFSDAVDKIKSQQNCDIKRAEELLFQFLRNSEDRHIDAVINVIAHYRIMTDNEIEIFVSKLKWYLDCGNRYVMPLKNFDTDKNGLYEILVKDSKIAVEFERGKPYSEKLNSCLVDFKSEKVTNNKVVFVSDVGLSGSQLENIFNNYKASSDAGIESDKSLYDYSFELLTQRITASSKIIFLNVLYTPVYKQKVIKLMGELFDVNAEKINFEGTEIDNFKEFCFNALHQKDREGFIEFINVSHNSMLNKKVCGQISYSDYLDLCNKTITTLSDEELAKTLLLGRRRSLPKYSQLVLRGSIFNFKKEEKL